MGVSFRGAVWFEKHVAEKRKKKKRKKKRVSGKLNIINFYIKLIITYANKQKLAIASSHCKSSLKLAANGQCDSTANL